MPTSYKKLLLLCYLALCSNVIAQEKKHPAAIPPDGFQFSGLWNCEGAMGNGKIHKSAFQGSLILDGKWLELSEQDLEPATGYVAKYLIGYDSQQERLVEFDANNFGAAAYTSAEGWTNRVLTMTSPISDGANAPYSADRFLYSLTDANTFIVDWQISQDRGTSWKPGDHLVCKRRAGA
jgi:hypothetical protein